MNPTILLFTSKKKKKKIYYLFKFVCFVINKYDTYIRNLKLFLQKGQRIVRATRTHLENN